jgi:hypothetical protein
MKEQKLIYREKPSGSIETDGSTSEKGVDVSNEDLEAVGLQAEQLKAIKDESIRQASLDEQEATDLFKQIDEAIKVEKRITDVVLPIIRENKAVSKEIASYLVKNMPLVKFQIQEELFVALDSDLSIKTQAPEELFALAISLEKSIGKPRVENLITKKLTLEIKKIQETRFKPVDPLFLKTISEPYVKNLVSFEQWKIIWDRTEKKDHTLWSALALPNMENRYAQN